MKNLWVLFFLASLLSGSMTSYGGDEGVRRRDFWFSCFMTFFTGAELFGKHHPSFEEMNSPHSGWKNLPIQKLGESFKTKLISQYGLSEAEAELQRVRLQELLWFRVRNFYSVLESREYQAQGEVTFKDVVFLNELEVDLPNGERLKFKVNPTWHIVLEKVDNNPIKVKNIIAVGDLETFVSSEES